MTFNVTFPVETQTPYRRKFVSIRHGGPRSRQCASGVIHGVIIIIEFDGSQRWLIAVTVQLTSSWLYGSLLMTRTALHSRCATVTPSTTTRVQNYAGSGIQRGSC